MEWFPWYPALYRADTMHLTAEQDGVYRRLIDEYMITRRPLPDNDHALARIAGLGLDQWVGMAQTVRAFFKASDGLLRHKRCDAELERQDGRASHLSELGKKGAEARKRNQKVVTSDGKPAAVPVAEAPAKPPLQRAPERPLKPPLSDSHSASLSRETKTETGQREAAASEVAARAISGEVPAAVQIIDVFDAERVAVFGASQGRPWKAADDHLHAKTFLAAGADAAFCAPVFRSVFERMKAKGKRPADGLSYMRKPIEDALFDIPGQLARRPKSASADFDPDFEDRREQAAKWVEEQERARTGQPQPARKAS